MAATKQYPAGRYFIGDLCYVAALGDNNDRWNRMCDMMFPSSANGRDDPGSHVIDGMDFWYHGTEFGDGCYQSNIGIEFPVDAGIIGICTAEVAESLGHHDGAIVSFGKPFTPLYSEGTFYIGHVSIYTGPENDTW